MSTVSLIIVTHNRLEQLKRVIPSIEQQEVPYELIVVDDGSDDNTMEWVMGEADISWGLSGSDDSVFYYKIPKHIWRNPSHAKNLGVSLTSGDIIIIQDAEILHEGNILETVNDFFHKAKGYDYIIMLKPEGAWYEEEGRDSEWQDDPPRTCMLFAMLRDEFIQLGGFNEKWYTQWGNDDVEFTERIRASGGTIVEHPDMLIRHLAHPLPHPVKEKCTEEAYQRWLKECEWKEKYVRRLKLGLADPRLLWRH